MSTNYCKFYHFDENYIYQYSIGILMFFSNGCWQYSVNLNSLGSEVCDMYVVAKWRRKNK